MGSEWPSVLLPMAVDVRRLGGFFRRVDLRNRALDVGRMIRIPLVLVVVELSLRVPTYE